MGLWGMKYADADEKWWVDVVLQEARRWSTGIGLAGVS